MWAVKDSVPATPRYCLKFFSTLRLSCKKKQKNFGDGWRDQITIQDGNVHKRRLSVSIFVLPFILLYAIFVQLYFSWCNSERCRETALHLFCTVCLAPIVRSTIKVLWDYFWNHKWRKPVRVTWQDLSSAGEMNWTKGCGFMYGIHTISIMCDHLKRRSEE